MSHFEVWAPLAKKIELKLAKETVPMQAGESGWWRARASGAGHGTDYGFVVDGSGPLPDPRSMWQPAGVHGLSRVVDHGLFGWRDAGWQAPPLSSALVYELHIGTFTEEGTFEAAIEKLEHLADLGVTHVEIMPVNEFSGTRGWGYDGADLFAPHHAYGGPDGLKRLVDACHARKLAVLLDVVYNHLGPSGNYLAKFGPYFTERYNTPWGAAVNFDDAESDQVRRFFIDNALMWLRDYHIDGLRIDAVHAIFDSSAIHFLEQLAAEVEALEARLGRHLVLIAESDLNDPRLLWQRGTGGFGLGAQWLDEFHHALHAMLTGENNGYYADFGGIGHLAASYQRAFVYDGHYSRHRRRRFGRPIGALPGSKFVAFLQNHDQIGNRAQGDRTSHLLSPGRLKIGAALLFAAPFVPMLFQGEEWGASSRFLYFTDHEDPELARAVREGRRREFAPFGWDPEQIPDPQAEETFQRSKLNWDELGQPLHAGLLDWHRRLGQLRRSLPDLCDGRLEEVGVEFDETAQWLVIRRGRVCIACNLAERAQPAPLPEGGSFEIALASDSSVRLTGGRVELGPDAVVILAGQEGGA